MSAHYERILITGAAGRLGSRLRTGLAPLARKVRLADRVAIADAKAHEEVGGVVLNRSEKEWKMGPRKWVMAKAQLAVIFGERFTRAMAAILNPKEVLDGTTQSSLHS